MKMAAPSANIIVLPGLNHNLRDVEGGERSGLLSPEQEPFTGSGAREAITHWLESR